MAWTMPTRRLVVEGAERVHVLFGIVKAPPGQVRRLRRNDDLVEVLIARPKRLPGGAVGWL